MIPAPFLIPLSVALTLLPYTSWAADSIPLLSANTTDSSVDFTVKTQILILMTLLGLLPVLVLMMTSFTRFAIILGLLRQALGLQQGLPNRVVMGIALILTLLVMRPVGSEVWHKALQPFDQDKITMPQALDIAQASWSRFMLAQTNKTALAQMAKLSGEAPHTAPKDYAFVTKLAAFVLSELKTAFQIGCMIFIPFLVIDIVVSSVLMAMGMMMLSPLVISLPLKLLLFVLVDGWSLTVNTLVTSIQGY